MRHPSKLLSKKNFVVLLLLLVLVITLFVPIRSVVAVEFENTGKLVAYYPASSPQKFAIRYTHSVHKTPVLESYRLAKNNDIVQYELTYENFAIGMPSNAEEGERFVQRDGKYIIENMDRAFPFIDVRVGQVVANHTLIIEGKEVPFHTFTKPGSWVRLKAKKISLWQAWKGVNILDR
ncbi:DUF1850 domain-containing protein [Pseudalkalibacillus caeni]|uniref:DUF1850 domain-containing protein n=1 Tax=Exobacillus caeni TaxID=2574798 RepID=A0A5R9F2H5_9BACL|nr:DUF1850 domain-containing protein [Pseudalkalibacillus caeni]TLS36729.1 DUF1850 domain-containing protein [Pseudalkalibacillus caeni]